MNGAAVGLKTGRISWSVRGISGVAAEVDRPGAYWFHVIEYSVLGFALGFVAVWMFRQALRGLRK